MISARLSIADSAYKKYIFPVGGRFYNFSKKFIGEMAADFATDISGIISGVDGSSSALEIARDSVRENFRLNYFSGDTDLNDIAAYEQNLSNKLIEFDLCFGREKKHFLDDGFFENRILVSVVKKVVSCGFEFPNYSILKDFLSIRFSDWDSEAVDLFYGALLRVTTPKFWEKIFLYIRSQWREARARAEGRVCKTVSPYLSSASLREFIDKISSTEKFLDKFVLENSDGEQIDLRDAYKSGNSNPGNRRRELMLRLRSTDEYFNSLNYKGYFLTITAPSSYHANKIGGLNPRCSDFEVRSTHFYMCGIWRNIFRKFARENILAAGYRLVEPHHDGTPHWHCLIWFSPDNASLALKIMQNYFTKTDFAEIAGRIPPGENCVGFENCPLMPTLSWQIIGLPQIRAILGNLSNCQKNSVHAGFTGVKRIFRVTKFVTVGVKNRIEFAVSEFCLAGPCRFYRLAQPIGQLSPKILIPKICSVVELLPTRRVLRTAAPSRSLGPVRITARLIFWVIAKIILILILSPVRR